MSDVHTVLPTNFFDPENFGAKVLDLEFILRTFLKDSSYPVRNSCISALGRGMNHDGLGFGNFVSFDEVASLFEQCISGILPYYKPDMRQRLGVVSTKEWKQAEWYENALETLFKAYLCAAQGHFKDESFIVRAIEFVARCQTGEVKPLGHVEAVKLILGYAIRTRRPVDLEEFLALYLKLCDEYLLGVERFTDSLDAFPLVQTRQVLQYMARRGYRPEILVDRLKEIEKLAVMYQCRLSGAPQSVDEVRSVVALLELRLLCQLVTRV